MLKRIFLIVSLAISLAGVSPAVSLAGAATQGGRVIVLDSASGTVSFEAIGRPSMLKIKGTGKALKGSLKIAGSKVSGSCSFDLDSLETGLSMRDKHMKEKYLEVAKFPQATLTLTDLQLSDSAQKDSFIKEKIPFKGLMKLHGVEKAVEGSAEVSRGATGYTVVATFPVKTPDFSIATPTFAGITVADNVTITVEFAAPAQ